MRSGDFSSLTILTSILWIFHSRATSTMSGDPSMGITIKSNDSSTTDSDRIHSIGHDSAVEGNFKSTSNADRPDFLTCLLERWYNANAARSDGCYHHHFWSSWESIGNTGGDDRIVQGRQKSKKRLTMGVMTLMLGAAIKLILFLPVLAVLTGKAISLSLTSLLITSLAFLHKTQ